MHKPLLAMLTVSLLFSSTLALADLEQDMDQLKGGLRVVTRTDDQNEMIGALADMRKAAQDARTQTPDKLQGQPKDSAQVQDFHAGIDSLIAQIDVIGEMAKANNIAGAKNEAKKLSDIRDTNHKKFR